MDDVWCSLDMATDIAGLHGALADPFLQPFTDSAVSSIGDDNAYFGVADVDLMVSADKVEGMAGMDARGFFGGLQQHELMQSSASSSLSSKRSLSLNSGGSSGSFTLDAAVLAAANVDASRYHAPAPPHPFAAAGDHDDEAIMRAMMAVMSSSSASPSSSASASASSQPPPFCRDSMLPQLRGGRGNGHVMLKSSLSVPPEQQEEPRTVSGNGDQQLYHMMSERKRREKLNDGFQTLRSLLPPCSKKDKTTVLTNAASYLKTLEAQVSELEEKNTKLVKHIPICQDAGATAMGARAPHQQRQRAKVQISKAAPSDEAQLVNLTVMVMVMVECDVVDLVLRILECLRWMEQISVLSVDADTYSPQVLFKAIASIKLRIMDDGDWNEASFHEAMTKAVNDATSSPSCSPLVLTT